MSAAITFPPVPARALSAGPAGLELTRQAALLAVVLRVSSAVGAGAVAVVGMAPPARPAWVVMAVVLLLGWTAVFAVVLRRRGLRTWLFLGDAVLVVGLCLAQEQLVPAAVLAASAATGWVDMVVGTSVFLNQFGLRQPLGLAVTFAVIAAYAVTVSGVREAPVVLVVQALLCFALVALLRRSARGADLALAWNASARAAEAARSAARVDELDQQRLLHDTVLATLTMVSTGNIGQDSAALHQRAADDLTVIENLRRPDGTRTAQGALARLDHALRAVALADRPGLAETEVELDLCRIRLSCAVVACLAESVGEAMANVARHAGATAVQLVAKPAGTGVIVEIRDDGRGFDATRLPAHRRGLRESVCGRMRAIGGSGEARSSPGEGTTVVLRWPHG